MSRWPMIALIAVLVIGLQAPFARAEKEFRRLPVSEYVDKMKAGWIGQMAGVGQGAPTEFRWRGEIIPEDKMPRWKPGMINQFHQDDIYVEMTFLRTLELYGMDASIRQAGIDFANSGYPLWHANRAGRTNLRKGIAPPHSGHPKWNKHADDIDYQIEADYAGLISPGLPNTAIALGEKFGRLMNFGDGLYGGQFVGGMYAKAFFDDDMEQIVRAGLECIPEGSQYHECISDVLRWHRQHPDDWKKTWELINEKYHENPDYRRFSCSGPEGAFNIDAKINGAYIVMGLLYGDGDPDRTIVISTRCGQDSDCNPSNAAGILFTTMGFEGLPERYKSALDPDTKFTHTSYNFPQLIDVCKELTRQEVRRAGGRVEKNADGEEVFLIPVQDPQPSPLEQCWDAVEEPEPEAPKRFTEKEMEQITATLGKDISDAVKRFAPGWKAEYCGQDMDPGLRDELRGKKDVLLTHPFDQQIGCVLSQTVDLPADKKSTLTLVVGNDHRGDWLLIVRANDDELLRKTIGPDTTEDGWTTVEIDLSKYAGKEVKLELVNKATGWRYEAGHWAEISLTHH